MKVLTIGNSFSDNATEQMLDILAAENNVDLTVGRTNLGGCSLEKHWNLVEQCNLLPDIKPYGFYLLGEESTPMNLCEALTCHKWDFVTLQQVSYQSWQAETYLPYVDNLYALIKELAPQAEPLLHQTWAYRIDNNDFFAEFGIDQMEMHKRIAQAYKEIAERLECRILPSGEAVQKARRAMNFTHDTDFDYDTSKPLKLPEQSRSLNVGYLWRTGNTPTGKAELHFDPRHLNNKGCYIANAVWFEMFTGRSIADNPWIPDFLSLEELALFKKVAHEAVVEYGGSFIG